MENFVIGIEGLVGAGKTSICRELLNIVPNSILLNGGNLYRCIIYALLSTGKSIDELKVVLKNTNINDFIEKFKIEIKLESKETCFYINGVKVSEENLQSEQSSLGVSTISQVADNSKLFVFAREFIDNFKKQYNIILSGRAIMDIYPDTNYHFFVTASLDERVRRKCIQYQKSSEKDIEEIRQNIITRDDLQEKSGYYKLHPKTITVDVTECANIKESTNKILEHLGKELLCLT